MIDKDKVFSFVKNNGPVLPRDVSKVMGSDTFFTGAVLSQLVDNKEIKISRAKIGGSPVYYLAGQEEKLNMLYKYLPQKEKEAFDLLKQNKVLRDNFQEPAIRVALRSIKDFAKPLEVVISEKKEIFWKWYLSSNYDAELLIRQLLNIKVDVDKNEIDKRPLGVETPIEKEAVMEEKKPESQEKKPENKINGEVQEKIHSEKIFPVKAKEDESELLSHVKKIFIHKEIEILDTKIIRRNSEIDMVISIPSPAGKLKYFCKVRDKKKSNDKDLSSVYVEGQMKKMPVLYVTTGELTKKAEEMLNSEFKMVSVMYLK
jgi:hypothetical protein